MQHASALAYLLGLKRTLYFLCSLTLLVLPTSIVTAAQDLSGTWLPAAELSQTLKPEAFKFTDSGKQAFASFDPQRMDSTAFCMPYGTPRNTLNTAPDALEILQRPEQITLIFDRLARLCACSINGAAVSNLSIGNCIATMLNLKPPRREPNNMKTVITARAYITFTLLTTFMLNTSIQAADLAPADFSGVWMAAAIAPDGRKNQVYLANLPFLAEVAQQYQDYLDNYNLKVDDDSRSCLPYGMPRQMVMLAQYPTEFIQTDDRLTMITELHNDVRRMYFSDHKVVP